MMDKYAVTLCSGKNMYDYYFGESQRVKEAYRLNRPADQIGGCIKFYKTEEEMLQHIDEAKEFLAGEHGVRFIKLSNEMENSTRQVI